MIIFVCFIQLLMFFLFVLYTYTAVADDSTFRQPPNPIHADVVIVVLSQRAARTVGECHVTPPFFF